MKAAAVVWALKRYKIAIIAITGISFFISIFYSMYVVKPVYGAKALIMVTTTDEKKVQNFDYNTILANRQLVKTYSEIIKSSTVLDRVVQQMGDYITLEQLRKAISVKQVGSTELLEISALSGDPLIAVYIANETANVFARHIEEVFRLTNVKILETAVENASPVKPNICLNIIAAVMLGFCIAVAFCLTLVYFRQPVGMPGMIDASVLFMSQIPKLKQKNKNWGDLFKNKIIHNAFVYLQTVLVKKVGKNKIILLTSAVDGVGKSTISEGLAFSLSQSGYKVTMINADFSRTEVQYLFKGMPLRRSISETGDVLDVFQSDVCPELRIVVAASPIVDSYQFLSSTAFEGFLQEAAAKSDLILINGPALQEHAEAVLLATKVEGVLFVARSDTPAGQFNKSLRSLESVNAGLLGIILNNI